MQHLWGIDLGGTKIEGVILDPARPGEPIHRLRLPTEAARGYEHVVAQIVRVVEQLEGAAGTPRPRGSAWVRPAPPSLRRDC
jgi:predicted NBD/HSP70 family sugar kinase